MRQRETNIWSNTKEWLDEADDKKLLIVLDEAHMYRGSAGGEIALLLERLFYRLGISKDRVQFILTTASMPQGEKGAIDDFYTGLTGKSPLDCEFLFGTREDVSDKSEIKADIDALASLGTDQVREEEISDRIKLFANAVFHTNLPDDYTASQAQSWLYDNLPKCDVFVALNSLCRDGAKSYSQIKSVLFGDLPNDEEACLISSMAQVIPIILRKNLDT